MHLLYTKESENVGEEGEIFPKVKLWSLFLSVSTLKLTNTAEYEVIMKKITIYHF